MQDWYSNDQVLVHQFEYLLSVLCCCVLSFYFDASRQLELIVKLQAHHALTPLVRRDTIESLGYAENIASHGCSSGLDLRTFVVCAIKNK